MCSPATFSALGTSLYAKAVVLLIDYRFSVPVHARSLQAELEKMATGFALQGLTLSAAGAELSAADSEYRLDVVAMRAVAALIASDDSDHSAAWRAMRTGIGAMRRAEAKAQKQKQAAAGFGAAASMCVIMGCFLASSRACFCIWRVCVLVFSMATSVCAV